MFDLTQPGWCFSCRPLTELQHMTMIKAAGSVLVTTISWPFFRTFLFSEFLWWTSKSLWWCLGQTSKQTCSWLMLGSSLVWNQVGPDSRTPSSRQSGSAPEGTSFGFCSSAEDYVCIYIYRLYRLNRLWQILLCRPLEETTRKLGMTEWLSTLGKTLVDLSRFSSGWVINRGVASRGLGPRPQLKASSLKDCFLLSTDSFHQLMAVSNHWKSVSIRWAGRFSIFFNILKLANDTICILDCDCWAHLSRNQPGSDQEIQAYPGRFRGMDWGC